MSPVISITVACGNEVYKPIDFDIPPYDNNTHIFDRKLDGNTTIKINNIIVMFETDTP